MRTGLIQSIGLPIVYTIPRHMQAIKQQIDTCPVWLCFDVLFNQTHGMGQERSTPWQRNKPLAKNALPAAVVPRRDRAKGNREERGGHHATIWTDLSTKHTEEIKVMQAPFASMLGHRLRVDKHKDSYTHTHKPYKCHNFIAQQWYCPSRFDRTRPTLLTEFAVQ